MKITTSKLYFTDQVVKNVIKMTRFLIGESSGNRHSTAGRMYISTDYLEGI